MKADDYLKWFDDLTNRFVGIPRQQCPNHVNGVFMYETSESQSWASEAASALAAVFPAAHPCREDWERLAPKMAPRGPRGGTLEQLFGIVSAAKRQIADGRLGSLLEAARVETEDELLDQAVGLLKANHLIAAAVIAGGALETHLRHLVAKHLGADHPLIVAGDGSIGKYDGAIAKARNDGTASAYPPTDSKFVQAWGGIRNMAAHTPTEFAHSQDDVQRMIDGIRGFISRTA